MCGMAWRETPGNGVITREAFYYELEWISAKGRSILRVVSTKLQVQFYKEATRYRLRRLQQGP
jgi:hypothetical protein